MTTEVEDLFDWLQGMGHLVTNRPSKLGAKSGDSLTSGGSRYRLLRIDCGFVRVSAFAFTCGAKNRRWIMKLILPKYRQLIPDSE